MTTLLCEKIVVAKSKEMKPGSNLTESSEQGYGSKMAVSPMMMMMMIPCKHTHVYIYTVKNRCKNIARTFSYTIDLDYLSLETKMIVVQ
jgi:hypothetical protein